MDRIAKLCGVIYLLLPLSTDAKTNVDHIVFGSCGHQDKPMPILYTAMEEQPDLFIFLGDNIYGDTQDMGKLQAKYNTLAAKPEFSQLITHVPTIAMWDDHDFGENDAGKHYPKKAQSKQIMLDFWQEPEYSARRSQPDGIYTSYMYNEPEQRIHVILPDLRWNRDDLNRVSTFSYLTQRKPRNMGPYSKSEIANASMLGEQQWQWLEEELQKPAKIKIIGSSLQVLANFTGWEAWANFPHDLTRLQHLIKKHRVNGVVLISGDTHWGEISYLAPNDDNQLDYPLIDVTSSGLTQEWHQISPNEHRYGPATSKVNFGVFNVDWQQVDPTISLALKNISGDVVNEISFSLSKISPYRH